MKVGVPGQHISFVTSQINTYSNDEKEKYLVNIDQMVIRHTVITTERWSHLAILM